jgi:hypothetical protein
LDEYELGFWIGHKLVFPGTKINSNLQVFSVFLLDNFLSVFNFGKNQCVVRFSGVVLAAIVP